MPENEFTGITQDEAEQIAKEAYARGDWDTLSKLQVADEATGELPGVPSKTTLGAKDVR